MVKEKEVEQTKNTTNSDLKYCVGIRLTSDESTSLKSSWGVNPPNPPCIVPHIPLASKSDALLELGLLGRQPNLGLEFL